MPVICFSCFDNSGPPGAVSTSGGRVLALHLGAAAEFVGVASVAGAAVRGGLRQAPAFAVPVCALAFCSEADFGLHSAQMLLGF